MKSERNMRLLYIGKVRVCNGKEGYATSFFLIFHD